MALVFARAFSIAFLFFYQMDAYGEVKVVVMDVGSHSIKSGLINYHSLVTPTYPKVSRVTMYLYSKEEHF
jgi:hypothetical protein